MYYQHILHGTRIATFHVLEDIPTPTPTLIAAPGAGYKLRIHSISVSAPDSGTAVDLGEPGFDPAVDNGKWKWGRIPLGNKPPMVEEWNPAGWFECAENTALTANGAIRGSICYSIVPL